MLERKLISAAVVGLALLAGAVPARAQSFRPARPPINWSQHDPANKAMHNLGYCINLHMVAWYNALQGRFSDAQLERAALDDRFVGVLKTVARANVPSAKHAVFPAGSQVVAQLPRRSRFSDLFRGVH